MTDFKITQLTDNTISDRNPQINDQGAVVWSGGGFFHDIYLYDKNTIKNISNSALNDIKPQISNRGVVWQADGSSPSEIYFFNGVSKVNLTNNTTADIDPQITVNFIVWEGQSQIYAGRRSIFWSNGEKNFQVSHHSLRDSNPQINSRGHTVWQGQVSSRSTNDGIYLYKGFIPEKPLTNNATHNGRPQINSRGDVVWLEFSAITNNYGIYLHNYNGTIIKNISNSAEPSIDTRPQISNYGVVWTSVPSGESDSEIYLYNGTSVRRLTDNNVDDEDPQINDQGRVVWVGGYSSDSEIYFYNGTNITQLTNNNTIDRNPQINSQSRVV